MTLKDLQGRVSVRLGSWYGHYRVKVRYRGKIYSCTSTNSVAWDYHNDFDSKGFYTPKQALQAFYEECLRKNNLKE